MAIDNTPPRLKLIVTIGIITVVTLVGIDFVFKSYYATMTDQAQREKIAPVKDREDQHKAEALALSQAAMPVDKAMAQLASGRPDAITPQPSDDLGAVTGWSKLPHPTPVPAAHDATPAPTTSDAGALAVGDGGATTLTGDAGAAMLGGDAGKPTTNLATKPDAGKH